MTIEQIEKEIDVRLEEPDNEWDGIFNSGYSRGFRDGSQWRINSVWHDPSEVPEANKRVLVCFENVIGEYVYYRIRAFKPNVLKNWNMGNFSLDKVLYWAYLDDLLPERKEESK